LATDYLLFRGQRYRKGTVLFKSHLLHFLLAYSVACTIRRTFKKKLAKTVKHKTKVRQVLVWS
jgi:hypothetical protein